MSLDAATLALVAGELKNTLLDAKIDKIFEPTRDEVLMTLRTFFGSSYCPSVHISFVTAASDVIFPVSITPYAST